MAGLAAADQELLIFLGLAVELGGVEFGEHQMQVWIVPRAIGREAGERFLGLVGISSARKLRGLFGGLRRKRQEMKRNGPNWHTQGIAESEGAGSGSTFCFTLP